MITAVDTNVLLDLLIPGATHETDSRAAVARAAEQGQVIISEPVLAEIASSFSSPRDLMRFLRAVGVRFVRSRPAALHRAGIAWRSYTAARRRSVTCTHCGAPQISYCDRCRVPLSIRQHLIADFIIGAHALQHADALLTRDRRYYKTYFPKLRLI